MGAGSKGAKKKSEERVVEGVTKAGRLTDSVVPGLPCYFQVDPLDPVVMVKELVDLTEDEKIVQEAQIVMAKDAVSLRARAAYAVSNLLWRVWLLVEHLAVKAEEWGDANV